MEIMPVRRCLNFLRNSLTIMSVPPVELPARNISPSPNPNSAPPTTGAISELPMTGMCGTTNFAHSSISPEESAVLIIDEIINVLPKNIAPIIKSGTLIMSMSQPVPITSFVA